MKGISFAKLNLSPEIKRSLKSLGFLEATDIQAQAIPMIQAGYDVIGRSQTGTGKTLAFGIPAVESIESSEDKCQAQVLILCPTRELALQVCDEIRKIALYKRSVKVATVYGGAPIDKQIVQLKRANIVVGTPGRVIDHLKRRTLKLQKLKMIILDEADEMLSMGFREDIELVLQRTPKERQTILFSATMLPEILALTKKYQKNPKMIQVNQRQITLDSIQQLFYDVPQERKMEALRLLLIFHSPQRAIVFCNTKKMVDEVTEYLTQRGVSADGLHGDMEQPQRTQVMTRFKEGKTSILIATDVAARGIDVQGINFIFNYDIPQNPEYYVHRIGRTGRAGKNGTAVTICSGRRQVRTMYELAERTRSRIHQETFPSSAELNLNLEQNRIQQIRHLMEQPHPSCKYIVSRLIKEGYPPEDIAAAVLHLYYGKDSIAFEEIREASLKSSDITSDRICFEIGRSSSITANHIASALVNRTGVSKNDIEEIRILDGKAIVSIPSVEAEEIVAKMKGCRICGKTVHVTIWPAGKNAAPSSSNKTASSRKRSSHRRTARSKSRR